MPLFWHKHRETFSRYLYNDIDAYLPDGDRGVITKVDTLSTRKVPSAFVQAARDRLYHYPRNLMIVLLNYYSCTRFVRSLATKNSNIHILIVRQMYNHTPHNIQLATEKSSMPINKPVPAANPSAAR